MGIPRRSCFLLSSAYTLTAIAIHRSLVTSYIKRIPNASPSPTSLDSPSSAPIPSTYPLTPVTRERRPPRNESGPVRPTSLGMASVELTILRAESFHGCLIHPFSVSNVPRGSRATSTAIGSIIERSVLDATEHSELDRNISCLKVERIAGPCQG